MYSNIANRFDAIIKRLSQQGLSTSSLQNAQTGFIDGVNKYLSDNEAYKTATADLNGMNCVLDVSGFFTTLQSARSLQEQLAKDAAVIRDATSKIKTALGQVKQTLGAQESQKAGNG